MGRLIFFTICLGLLTLIYTRGQNLLGVSNSRTEVLLVGDVMLGRTVMTKSLDLKDTSYPFRKVADKLRGADLVYANLENPIIVNCPRHYDGFKFCTDPKMIEGLKFAGVDVVNLANNHTLNYGKNGFEETKKYLKDSGILFVGDNNLVIKVVNGTSFGFLGFDFVTRAPMEADYELIRAADIKVDVLIVGVHWGNEYKARANPNQREWAKRLVESGADVVSGHHPHWIQDIENINGKPVFYSLGNFIFDQMWSEKTRNGMVVELEFIGSQLTNQLINYVYMSSWAQPEFKMTSVSRSK